MSTVSIIDNPSTRTNMGKTKAEIIYDIVLANAGNTSITPNVVLGRSVQIYKAMVQSGVVKEYNNDDDFNYSECMMYQAPFDMKGI